MKLALISGARLALVAAFATVLVAALLCGEAAAHGSHGRRTTVVQTEGPVDVSVTAAAEGSHPLLAVPQGPKPRASTRDKWLWGMGTIAVISLTSLVGLVLVPITRRFPRASQHLMTFLVALSIGTLIGEAVMHLLPEAFGVHDHGAKDEDGHHHDAHSNIPADGGFMMALFTIIGIYTFFLFEKLLQRFHHGHGHSHSITPLKPGEQPKKQIRPVGWLILFGEIIHNLADGLAIGAAYSESVAAGMQLAIAVMWHEVPHELGDYAVLVNAGFSPFRALLWNSLANVSAFLGCIVALCLVNDDYTRNAIYAFTAGSFLYVALADLVPELQHEHEAIEDNPCRSQLPAPVALNGSGEVHATIDFGADIKNCKLRSARSESVRRNIRWVCQQSGMICGFAVMALVSKYLEH